MKTVTVKVMGQSAQVYEDFAGSTISDLKNHIDLEGKYTANANGEPASDNTIVKDGAYIVLSPSVKGA